MSLAATNPPKPVERQLFGHPIGLVTLVFAEAFERFSYYGMQTLFVLYMSQHLLLPGHVEQVAGFASFRAALERVYGPLSPLALGSVIFGLFTGGVYLAPIAGGYLADRFCGRTRTILFGAVSLAAGQFLMAFDVSFLVALLCLIAGVGCFKGNIASQLGGLYHGADARRANAFQLLFFGMCTAVVITQLVCGTLAALYGWAAGFVAAGVGMLLGLAVYLQGRRFLPRQTARQRGTAIPLTGRDWQKVGVILLIFLVLTVALIGNQQIYNSYLLWAEARVDLVFAGRTMPVTWLASFDSLCAIIAALLSFQFWRRLAKQGVAPDETAKMTIGISLQAAAMATLGIAALVTPATAKVGLGWILLYEIFLCFGGANIIPIILSLVARIAPSGVNATLISCSYLIYFGANMLVGWLGGLLERMDGGSFWLLHALLIEAAGLLIFAIGRLFRDRLTPAS